jgi:hypothetical protein
VPFRNHAAENCLIPVAIIAIIAAIAIPQLLGLKARHDGECVEALLAVTRHGPGPKRVCPASKQAIAPVASPTTTAAPAPQDDAAPRDDVAPVTSAEAPTGTREVVACPTPGEHACPPVRFERQGDGPWTFRMDLPAPPDPPEGGGPLELSDGKLSSTRIEVREDGAAVFTHEAPWLIRSGLAWLAAGLGVLALVALPLTVLDERRTAREKGVPVDRGELGCTLLGILAFGAVMLLFAYRGLEVDEVIVPPEGGRLVLRSTLPWGAREEVLEPVRALVPLGAAEGLTAYVGGEEGVEPRALFPLTNPAEYGALAPALENLAGAD